MSSGHRPKRLSRAWWRSKLVSTTSLLVAEAVSRRRCFFGFADGDTDSSPRFGALAERARGIAVDGGGVTGARGIAVDGGAVTGKSLMGVEAKLGGGSTSGRGGRAREMAVGGALETSWSSSSILSSAE